MIIAKIHRPSSSFFLAIYLSVCCASYFLQSYTQIGALKGGGIGFYVAAQAPVTDVPSAESSTPPAGKNTTDYHHMQTIVGSDVGHELPDDEFIDEEIQFDWSIALNDTSVARPFLICVNHGRDGVLMLKQICQNADFSNPVFSSSNITCYIIHETTEDLIGQMYMLPYLEFAIPFPGVLKQSKGLFWKIYSGCFFGETSNCEKESQLSKIQTFLIS